jgi:hypothetical protein
MMPVFYVVAKIGTDEIFLAISFIEIEIFDSHPEESIVISYVVKLTFDGLSHLNATVTVWTCIIFVLPRVSQLDQSLRIASSSGYCLSSQYYVRMILDKTVKAILFIGIPWSTC